MWVGVASADAAISESSSFKDGGSLQKPGQAEVSLGCVVQPDLTYFNRVDHRGDQCGRSKVFLMVDQLFCLSLWLIVDEKGTLLSCVLSARFCLTVLCEGRLASKFIDLKYLIAQDQMNSLIWR